MRSNGRAFHRIHEGRQGETGAAVTPQRVAQKKSERFEYWHLSVYSCSMMRIHAH